MPIQAGGYRLLSDQDPRRQSHCQLEAHVHYESIISHPPEGPPTFPYLPAIQCTTNAKTLSRNISIL